MSVIGLRVGPFEVIEAVTVPERGTWFLARRTGMTRKQPNEVLVKLAPNDATAAERLSLQAEFDHLRAVESFRVPSPLAFYDGLGALVIAAPRCVALTEIPEARRTAGVALSPATLLDLALEVADTLQHAHHRSRPHGHVQPGEIGLALDGRVWVFGFGPGPYATPAPAWTAPERARGEAPTPLTDQWGLAATLAYLVTGREPWAEPADAAKGDPAPIVGPVEAQWPALGRVLRRMLDPVPAHRYPSMVQVRQELFALARRAGGVSDRRSLALRLHRLRNPELPSDPVSDPGAPAPSPAAAQPAPEPPRVEAERRVPTEELETVEVARQPSLPLPAARPAARLTALPEPPSNPEIAQAVLSTGTGRGDRPAPRVALPAEAIPVVRPTLGSDLPRAVLGSGDPASAPDPDLAGMGTGFRLRPALSEEGDSDAEVVEPTAERVLHTSVEVSPSDPAVADTEPSLGASDAGVVRMSPPEPVEAATDRTAEPRTRIPVPPAIHAAPPALPLPSAPEPALNPNRPVPRIPIVPQAAVPATVELDDLDDEIEESEPGLSAPVPTARPAPVAMIRPAPVTTVRAMAVQVEELDELDDVEAIDASDAGEPGLGDYETDGFHLTGEGPTRFPTGTRSDPGTRGPALGALAPLGPTLALGVPGPSGDASSLGDGWFGKAAAPSAPPSEALEPSVALDAPLGIDVDALPSDDDETEEARPLRIPPLQLSLAQRVAPVAVAMMVVSLGVWTVVQIWA